VNGKRAGVTPLDHPFTFYGTFDITLRARHHRSVRKLEAVRAPWFEVFPLDFVSEHLVPWTIRDHRTLAYRLEAAPKETEEMEKVLERLPVLEKELDAAAAHAAPATPAATEP